MELAGRLFKLGSLAILIILMYAVIGFTHPAGSSYALWFLAALALLIVGALMAFWAARYLIKAVREGTLTKRQIQLRLGLAGGLLLLMVLSLLTGPNLGADEIRLLSLEGLFHIAAMVLGTAMTLWATSLILGAWNQRSLPKKWVLATLPVIAVFLLFVLDNQWGALASPNQNPWSLLLFVACWITSLIVTRKHGTTHQQKIMIIAGLCALGTLAFWWHIIPQDPRMFLLLVHPASIGAALIATAPIPMLFFFYPAWRNAAKPPTQDENKEKEREENTDGASL